MLFIDNFVNEDKKTFNKFRLIKRKKIDDAIIFIIIFIKIKYDVKYLFFILKKKDETFFKLYYDYFISSLINKKLSQQRVKSFKILNKINYLIYKLRLSSIIKIHFIIFIIQLKSNIKVLNSYKKRINTEILSIINKNNDIEINFFLKKRIICDKLKYLFK